MKCLKPSFITVMIVAAGLLTGCTINFKAEKLELLSEPVEPGVKWSGVFQFESITPISVCKIDQANLISPFTVDQAGSGSGSESLEVKSEIWKSVNRLPRNFYPLFAKENAHGTR